MCKIKEDKKEKNMNNRVSTVDRITLRHFSKIYFKTYENKLTSCVLPHTRNLNPDLL